MQNLVENKLIRNDDIIDDDYEEDETEILKLTDEKPIERIKPIEIFPYQLEHFKELLNIYQNSIGALNNSQFGAGKTVITIAVAIAFKMGILVIGPKTVLPTWVKQTKLYGVPLYGTLTYSGLRGTAKNGVQHEYLIRRDNEFFPTPKIEEMARKGLLIVYDECHYLKNENSQLEAAQAITGEAVRLARIGYSVRIAALSATPADKKENITSLFKILGVINSRKLYKFDRSSKTYTSLGLQEAVNKCNRYDPDTTFHVICRPINKTTSKLICHELYTRVLKKYITSSMPEPPMEYKKDIKNLFAIMPPEDVERIKKGALLFSSATNYKHETGEISNSALNWGDIIRSRREIDSAKVNTMVRLAKGKLEKHKQCKVVLYFTYKRDMHEAARQLKRYGVLVMNGDTVKTEDRVAMMDKFQRDDNDYRVFISNPKVGGVGISLEDDIGTRRRFMWLLPSYMFIDQFQATGRIHRKNTKSKATIRFIYSRAFPHETSLLQSMAAKSVVARDMIMENQTNVIFPGELIEKIEKFPGEKSDDESAE